MTTRTTSIMTTLALAGLAAFLCLLQTVTAVQPARALEGAGNGPGYRSSDGWWLGTYRLDDGAQGFCLHAGRPSPMGHAFDYVDGAALSWYTPEQAARLAYISRTWAGTGDRLTAAAGQIATWLLAGLGGHTPEQLAARAGADSSAVLARAHEMAEESAQRGSTGVRADAVLELADTGPGRLRVELTVDRLSGPELLPPGAHSAHVTLTDATFPDGTTSAEIPTGTDIPVLPSGREAEVAIAASATLGDLPYGDRITVAVPRSDAQAVLIAVPATASASASADATGPSPLPFQPLVTTTTSAARAEPGALITDHLTVAVDTEEGLLPSWGVRATPDGLEPIVVAVESTLLGPFADPIRPADTTPDDAPEVCTVVTEVTGPGDYETPACELPAAGYYVWVERIDPARVSPEDGGDRLRPWQSSFGVASEITLALAPPAPVTPPEPIALAATGSAPSPIAPTIVLGLLTVGAVCVGITGVMRRPEARS